MPSTAEKTATPMSFVTAVEKLILLHATNRFVWLAFILAAIFVLQLSLLQRNSMRFDTMELVAILMAILEAAGVAMLMLMLGGMERTRQAWNRRYPEVKLNYIAAVLAAMLVCSVLVFVMLVPLMVVHRYPDLAAEGLRVPVTMLQRTSLFLGVIMIIGNLICILRFYARLPWAVCAVAGLLLHILAGYLVTVGSMNYEFLHRLNDVFYYNQLWQYFDWVPYLQRPQLFFDIKLQYTSIYFLTLAGIWLVTFLLWVPRTLLTSKREEQPA